MAPSASIAMPTFSTLSTRSLVSSTYPVRNERPIEVARRDQRSTHGDAIAAIAVRQPNP